MTFFVRQRMASGINWRLVGMPGTFLSSFKAVERWEVVAVQELIFFPVL